MKFIVCRLQFTITSICYYLNGCYLHMFVSSIQDSLGGNANTLMICCISPSTANLDESLNAVKYANRARNIKNKPIVNRDPQSIRFEEMQSEIRVSI